VQKAACIITPSEIVKRDVIKYCKCREDNVHVVHYGIDKSFQPFSLGQRLEQRRRLGLPLDDHLILITGNQTYKNHGACFRAVEKLRQTLRRQVRIVRMGYWSKIWMKEYGRVCRDGTVIDLGFLPRDLTPSVYNAVDCLLFPSWYEGFGWPPLEAMACGVPVVASNVGSLPEVIGDAGHLCAPDDVVALAERLRDVLENAESRSDLIAKGLQRAKQFTWESHIEHICKLYNELSAGQCS
jgi:glycosyltransferase involved in cell wall biosynthesis